MVAASTASSRLTRPTLAAGRDTNDNTLSDAQTPTERPQCWEWSSAAVGSVAASLGLPCAETSRRDPCHIAESSRLMTDEYNLYTMRTKLLAENPTVTSVSLSVFSAGPV